MITRLNLLLLLLTHVQGLNLPPSFTADMNQFTLVENTPVGEAVYTLKGSDPEGSPVSFGIEGTDTFRVDSTTGVVTVARAIDRESQKGISDNEIRFSVVIRDKVEEGGRIDNVVKVPISVIILDLNDNPPKFSGLPYKATVNEDTPVGTTIYRALEARDVDLVGEILEVACLPPETGPNLCDYFEIIPRSQDTDIDMFRGSIVLKKPFNYRERQIYKIDLGVFDGKYNDTTNIVFNVLDVQNTPPVFEGSLTGIVNEDDAVGTVIMNIKAKDGDTGNPRRIIYELMENPLNYFDIDTNTGDLRIAKQLDRESLGASSGVLTLQVRASELINGQPGKNISNTNIENISASLAEYKAIIHDKRLALFSSVKGARSGLPWLGQPTNYHVNFTPLSQARTPPPAPLQGSPSLSGTSMTSRPGSTRPSTRCPSQRMFRTELLWPTSTWRSKIPTQASTPSSPFSCRILQRNSPSTPSPPQATVQSV